MLRTYYNENLSDFYIRRRSCHCTLIKHQAKKLHEEAEIKLHAFLTLPLEPD